MANKKIINNTMRVYHRYLGFFLAGIMGMYAVSGTIMIFRTTDFLKVEQTIERQLPPNIKNNDDLGRMLRIRDFKITSEDDKIVTFPEGTYNKETGMATYKAKELPHVLNKLTELHKASTNQPLFFLNIFFGASLLFFVVSSFWMFLPKTDIFKKGIYFAIAGLVLAFLLVLI